VSDDLKNKVAWGLDYSVSGKYGVENAQFIIQGQPKVRFSNGVAYFTASHIITRKSTDITSENSVYRPVLMALSRSDRNDFGFAKTRIFAHAYGDGKKHAGLIELTDSGPRIKS
jgi:hypothetical protein